MNKNELKCVKQIARRADESTTGIIQQAASRYETMRRAMTWSGAMQFVLCIIAACCQPAFLYTQQPQQRSRSST